MRLFASFSRLILCAILFFAMGCGPTPTAPYEPPEDEVTGTDENGEAILSEDSGP